MGVSKTAGIIAALCLGLCARAAEEQAPAQLSPVQSIALEIPASTDSAGGILVHDIDGDQSPDYFLSSPGHLAVYGNDGQKRWLAHIDLVVGGSSESQGLPGHHGPGVAAGDIDGDGHCEAVFLSKDGVVHAVDAVTGAEKAAARPVVPPGAARWELAVLADFRGAGGDGDVLLQATNREGYRMGQYLAAYAASDLFAGKPPLWTTDQFLACAHNGVRIADLNGDGKDEVLGPVILSAEGKELARAVGEGWHMDSVFVAELRPDLPGLEVILLEEGSNQVQVLGIHGLIWRAHYLKQEPQNAAVGRFKAGSAETFIWCRSRYNEHQKPFVFNATGEMVFTYEMDKTAPPGWTSSGVEVIHAIDWTGAPQQLACAKERHTSGDAGLFEPLSGHFVARMPEKADRLYVADVRGDWREEVIVWSGEALHIYENNAPNPAPDHPRLWNNRNYRRLKQCHNYYSP